MDFIKKHENQITGIMIAIVALLSVVPSLYICRYLYPVQDDFHYTRCMNELMNSGMGLVSASLHKTVEYYLHYCGCYSSSFLGFFVSGIIKCNIMGIRVLCFSNLCLFYVVLYYFVMTVVVDVFGIKKHEARWIFLLVLECITGLTYYAESEAFYWFITSIQYLFIVTCILAGAALLIRGLVHNHRYMCILSVPFALIGSGGALNISFMCSCAFGCIMIWVILTKQNIKYSLPGVLTALIGTFINGIAPGNYVGKGSGKDVSVGTIVQSVVLSYKCEFERYIALLKKPLFIFILLALIIALVFIKMPVRENGYRLPFLGIFILESVIAAVIFPVMFGYGWDAYHVTCRCRFVSDLTLFICTVLSLLYLKGWLTRIGVEARCSRIVGIVSTVILCVIAGIVLNGQWKKGTGMYQQYTEIKDGSMKAFSDYAVEIINQTKNSKDSIVTIHIPTVEDTTCLIDPQYTIGEHDITGRSGNKAMAVCYEKEGVIIIPEE